MLNCYKKRIPELLRNPFFITVQHLIFNGKEKRSTITINNCRFRGYPRPLYHAQVSAHAAYPTLPDIPFAPARCQQMQVRSNLLALCHRGTSGVGPFQRRLACCPPHHALPPLEYTSYLRSGAQKGELITGFPLLFCLHTGPCRSVR